MLAGEVYLNLLVMRSFKFDRVGSPCPSSHLLNIDKYAFTLSRLSAFLAHELRREAEHVV